MKLGKNFKQTFVEGYSEMLRGCRGKGVPCQGEALLLLELAPHSGGWGAFRLS